MSWNSGYDNMDSLGINLCTQPEDLDIHLFRYKIIKSPICGFVYQV